MKILRTLSMALVLCSTITIFVSASLGDWVKVATVTEVDWANAYAPSMADLKQNDGVFLSAKDKLFAGYISKVTNQAIHVISTELFSDTGDPIKLQGNPIKLKKAFEVVTDVGSLKAGDDVVFLDKVDPVDLGKNAQIIEGEDGKLTLMVLSIGATLELDHKYNNKIAKLTKQAAAGFSGEPGPGVGTGPQPAGDPVAWFTRGSKVVFLQNHGTAMAGDVGTITSVPSTAGKSAAGFEVIVESKYIEVAPDVVPRVISKYDDQAIAMVGLSSEASIIFIQDVNVSLARSKAVDFSTKQPVQVSKGSIWIVQSEEQSGQTVPTKFLYNSSTKAKIQLQGVFSRTFVKLISSSTTSAGTGTGPSGEPGSGTGTGDDKKYSFKYIELLNRYTDDQIAAMNKDQLVTLLEDMIEQSSFKSYLKQDTTEEVFPPFMTVQDIAENIQNRIDSGDTLKKTSDVLDSFYALTANALGAIRHDWESIDDLIKFQLAEVREYGGPMYPWYASDPKLNDKKLRILTQLTADCGYNALWNAIWLIKKDYQKLGNRKKFNEYLKIAKNFIASKEIQQVRRQEDDAGNRAKIEKGENPDQKYAWLPSDDKDARSYGALDNISWGEISKLIPAVVDTIGVELHQILGLIFPLEGVLEQDTELLSDQTKVSIQDNFRENNCVAFLVNLGRIGGSSSHWITICCYKDEQGVLQYIITNSLSTSPKTYENIAKRLMQEIVRS